MTHFGRIMRNVLVALAATLMLAASGLAQDSEKTLFTFGGPKSGAVGATHLISDPAGNLYGSTFSGGNNSTSCQTYTGVPGCGVVFKLTPTTQGSWVETVLYTFTGGRDGAVPAGGVVMDAKGNLYGITEFGGDEKSPNCLGNGSSYLPGCGVVFKLTPTAHGPWVETVLHTFTDSSDGAWPWSGVILDASGNVYGTASQGGATETCAPPYGCGVVFKLTPAASGSWPESILYAFTGTDGFLPWGGLTFGPRGNLYGVTYLAGDASASCFGDTGCGLVYKLAPTRTGLWKETVLYAFTGGADGGVPLLGVTLDSHGNVYGTTIYGGDTNGNCPGGYGYNVPPGCGVVFKLTPNGQGPWPESVLYTFTGGSDGGFAGTPVVLDSAGNLYGEAGGGDSAAPCENLGTVFGCGVVFELTPAVSGPWTESVLYSFAGGADGGGPESNLLLGSDGSLIGTTEAGGDTSKCTGNFEGETGCGVVFKLQ